MLRVNQYRMRQRGVRHVAVGRLLSGAGLLMVVTCIGRLGCAGLISAKSWEEAFQAATLVFLLRFGENRHIASTETILGIIIGATVGALGAFLRCWTAMALTVSVAMILIHHPCPSGSKTITETAITPSLGFWKLLLATFWFVCRSASGSGLRGCLGAAFAHTTLLVSAAELVAVLSVPNWACGAIGGDDCKVQEEGRGHGGHHSVSFPSPGAPQILSPIARRQGAQSPHQGAPWRGVIPLARSPTIGPTAAAAAGLAAPQRRRRRSSLPSFLDGDEDELAQLLPSAAHDSPGGGRGGGDTTGLAIRASCPVVPYTGAQAARLQRSSSAAIFRDKMNPSGCNGDPAAAGCQGVFTVSAASPIRWNGGRSRQLPTPYATLRCNIDALNSGGSVEAGDVLLSDGPSPDDRPSQQQQVDHPQQQRQPMEEAGSSPNTRRAAVLASMAEKNDPHGLGTAAGCGAGEDDRGGGGDRVGPGDRRGDGSLRERLDMDPVGGAAMKQQKQDSRAAGGQMEWSDPGRAAGDTDALAIQPRSDMNGQPRPFLSTCETGNSAQEYILLESTLPGTDGGAPYSGFSNEIEDDDEYDSDLDADVVFRETDSSASDGCFSLVIESNGTAVGDCVVGANRNWRAHGMQQSHGVSATAGASLPAVAAEDADAIMQGESVAALERDAGSSQRGEPSPLAVADGFKAAYINNVPAERARLHNGSNGHMNMMTSARAMSQPRKEKQSASLSRRAAGLSSALLNHNPTRNTREHSVTVAAAAATAMGDSTRGALCRYPSELQQQLAARWYPHWPPAVVRQLILDPYGCCDVADLADLDDLVSLEEMEVGDADVAAMKAVTAEGHKVMAAAGSINTAVGAQLPAGVVSGIEDPYSVSNRATPWLSGSAATSESRRNHARHHHHHHQPRGQQQQNLATAQLRGQRQHSSTDGAGSGVGIMRPPQSGSVGGVGIGVGGWAAGSSAQVPAPGHFERPGMELSAGVPSHQQHQQQPLPKGIGDADVQHSSYVPLEEKTLAQHLAAIKAQDVHRKQHLQQQLQHLQYILLQQRQQQQREKPLCQEAVLEDDGGVEAQEEGEGSRGGARGTDMAAWNTSSELLVCFLREAELLTSMGTHGADPGHAVGLGPSNENGTGPGDRNALAPRKMNHNERCDSEMDVEDVPVLENAARMAPAAVVGKPPNELADHLDRVDCGVQVHRKQDLSHDATRSYPYRQRRHHHFDVDASELQLQIQRSSSQCDRQDHRRKQAPEAPADGDGGDGSTGCAAQPQPVRPRGRRRRVRQLSQGQLHARQLYEQEYRDRCGMPYGHDYEQICEYGQSSRQAVLHHYLAYHAIAAQTQLSEIDQDSQYLVAANSPLPLPPPQQQQPQSQQQATPGLERRNSLRREDRCVGTEIANGDCGLPTNVEATTAAAPTEARGRAALYRSGSAEHGVGVAVEDWIQMLRQPVNSRQPLRLSLDAGASGMVQVQPQPQSQPQPPPRRMQATPTPSGAAGAVSGAAVFLDVSSDLPWADELETFDLSAINEQQYLFLQQQVEQHQQGQRQRVHMQQPQQQLGRAGEGLLSPGATVTTGARVPRWVGPQVRLSAPALSNGLSAWGASVGGSVAATATATAPMTTDATTATTLATAAFSLAERNDVVGRSGSSWGGGFAKAAASGAGSGSFTTATGPGPLLGSPQQLRCPTSPMAMPSQGAASAPSTPPTTVVEPFSAVGQTVYRSLSGCRRLEESDRRWGISDNYKAALAAAAAAAGGNRPRPATPSAAPKPPGSPLLQTETVAPVSVLPHLDNAAVVCSSAPAVAAAEILPLPSLSKSDLHQPIANQPALGLQSPSAELELTTPAVPAAAAPITDGRGALDQSDGLGAVATAAATATMVAAAVEGTSKEPTVPEPAPASRGSETTKQELMGDSASPSASASPVMKVEVEVEVEDTRLVAKEREVADAALSAAASASTGLVTQLTTNSEFYYGLDIGGASGGPDGGGPDVQGSTPAISELTLKEEPAIGPSDTAGGSSAAMVSVSVQDSVSRSA
ncbi:hypothetical protein Vafri_17342 [Volvox africanus]|uniref:Uncharacterized protein n=1 Tax=Volvox africanus TaxID=51714 RepID=A0A8J4BQ84_9CHLO|nr:hypothetical protein Vafri_17342 [Volvox africanus]